jgi:membrane glycosyltransferase
MPREVSMSEANPNSTTSTQSVPPTVNRLPDETVSQTGADKKSKRRMTVIGIGVAVVVILIIAGFVLMIHGGVTGVVRDILIIFLAIESLVLVGLMVVLVIQMMALVRIMRDEVRPLIASAQETVNSARGTTQFVSRKIVTPTASAAANVAQVRRMFQVLFKGK